MHKNYCTCPNCAREKKVRKIGIASAIGVSALIIAYLVSQSSFQNSVSDLSGQIGDSVSNLADDAPRRDPPTITTFNPDGSITTLGQAQFNPSEGKEKNLSEQVAQRNYDEKLIASLIHEKVNVLRETKGVPLLTYDDRLQVVALKHSIDMSERDFFDHDNPDGQDPTMRGRTSGYDCRKTLSDGRIQVGLGENILTSYAYGSYTTSSFGSISYNWRTNEQIADDIFDGWYESTGHRLNMYNASYDKEGIGIYIDDYARVFATQNFC